MSSLIAILISGLALGISALNAWLTFFRRGDLQMTQPTVIYFGPDGDSAPESSAKVYLRTLLFSSSHRGQMIESMHLGIQRGETRQNFSIWVYGEERLSRGSGLFVGHDGIVLNHHFLLPHDGADFKFIPGDYWVRVYAKRIGDVNSTELMAVHLVVTEANTIDMQAPDAGLYFDWGPDQQAYQSHVKKRPRPLFPEELLKLAH